MQKRPKLRLVQLPVPPPAKESATRFIISGVGTQTRIELARYGPKAGVRGAALLAGQELEREALPLQETKES